LTLTNATGLPVSGISATGTPGSNTYLEGDGKWATISGGGSTVGFMQNDTIGNGTPTAFTDGALALFSVSLPAAISLSKIAVDAQAGAGNAAWSVCLFNATGTLVAAAPRTTQGDAIDWIPVTGGPISVSAGDYFFGVVTSAGGGLTAAEAGGFNGIGNPANYINYTFETGLSGTCPANITPPTLAATSGKVTWIGLTAH